MKKILICLLALVMLLSATGVLAEIPSVFPYEGEEITLRVMGWTGYNDFNYETTVGRWIKSTIGNVKLEMEIPSEDATILSELYLSSGEDMPDVIIYRAPEQFMKNGYGARCVNLHDYADYMPNWNRLRETNAHLSWYEDEDGAAYILNPVRVNRISEVWYYNADLLAKYGLEVPTTYDEMENCMSVVCAAEPDVEGMLFTAWGQGYAVTSLGTLFGMEGRSYSSIHWDYEKGEWEHNLISNEAEIKATISALAKAYANGWINKDFITWDSAAVNAKANTGKFLFHFAYDGNGATYANNGVNVGIMNPPMANGKQTYQKADYVSETTEWVYVVTNTCKHPEMACAFIDLLLSDEWAIGTNWGIEGETYTVDENGKYAYTQEVLDLKATDTDASWAKYGLATDKHYSTVFFSQGAATTAATFANYTEAEVEYTRLASEKLSSGEWKCYYAANWPGLDEQIEEDTDVVWNTWDNYISEAMAEFIYGTKSVDSDWDAFMAGLDMEGISWVIEEYNKGEQKPLKSMCNEREYAHP